MLQTGPAGTLPQDYIEQLNNCPVGNGGETRINRYDADVRLLHQRVMKSDGEAKYDIAYEQYDAAGNFAAHSNTVHGDGGYTANYTYTQLRLDGYKQAPAAAAATMPVLRIVRAYRAIQDVDPTSTTFSEQIINAIYDERGRTRPDGTLAYFRSASPAQQAGVIRRFGRERNDALQMLRNQGAR